MIGIPSALTYRRPTLHTDEPCLGICIGLFRDTPLGVGGSTRTRSIRIAVDDLSEVEGMIILRRVEFVVRLVEVLGSTGRFEAYVALKAEQHMFHDCETVGRVGRLELEALHLLMSRPTSSRRNIRARACSGSGDGDGKIGRLFNDGESVAQVAHRHHEDRLSPDKPNQAQPMVMVFNRLPSCSQEVSLRDLIHHLLGSRHVVYLFHLSLLFSQKLVNAQRRPQILGYDDHTILKIPVLQGCTRMAPRSLYRFQNQGSERLRRRQRRFDSRGVASSLLFCEEVFSLGETAFE